MSRFEVSMVVRKGKEFVGPQCAYPRFLPSLSELSGFTHPFGDVGRGLVYPVPLCRGATHCYTVSICHAGAAPPPRLLALHVPHRDRCCDAPPEPRDRDLPCPPPRSGTATTPPLPGCGRPIAPAGMEHALAWL